MVKYDMANTTPVCGFSPLLILFMVKSHLTTMEMGKCFSPLLILFMVKSTSHANLWELGFSPLLILFMVKFRGLLIYLRI